LLQFISPTISSPPTNCLPNPTTPSFRLWKQFYAGQKWMVQRIEKLETDLNVLSRMRPFSAVNYIRKAVDYEGYLKEFAAQRKIPADDLFDVLDEIQEDASGYAGFSEWLKHMEEVKREWAEQFVKSGTEESAVHLITLHASKGLEFDTVFLVDACEGLTPYKKAVFDPDIEEERRLFYVGMTRARKRLYILHPNRIHNKDMQPSRFLKESIDGLA
ncbi:MAG: ATP-dependent helicase, partial [Clostridiales bacterium]|nr:ATP-dependent helicase [Clostridiales bacterium]